MRVVLFYLFLFFSCSSNKELSESACTKDFKKYININWKYDTKKEYYIYEKDFEKKLDSTYRDCILTLNKEQIINLFGKPSVIRDYSYEDGRFKYILSYLISPPCTATFNDVKCWYYKFYFGPSGKVILYSKSENFGSRQD